jgi:hypothetical protein
MQDAMQQQKIEFMLDGYPGLGSIAGRSLHRDYYVAEQVSLHSGPLPFLHGEGNHVGRPVLAEPGVVQLANACIIDEQNREPRLRTSRDA